MYRSQKISSGLMLIVILWTAGIVWVPKAQAQPTGLVAHWQVDEVSGTVAPDASGSGNDGTLIGAPTWTTGFYDGALQFAAAGDGVEFSAADISSSTGAVALWAYLDSDQSRDTRYFFGHTTIPPYGNRIQLYMDGGNTQLDVGMGGSHALATNIIELETETWYHLALVWDNGAYILYLDGSVLTQGSYTGLAEIQDVAQFGNNGSGNNDQGFNGIIDDVWLFNEPLTAQGLAFVMGGGSDPALASGPLPADEDTDIIRNGIVLNWLPGQYAASHDVYFGTNLADVNEASRANPGNILISQGQADTSYALDRLELGQTYFWRIDEVNAAPDNSIHKGPVWSFTVEPVSYPLPGASITATASGANRDTTGPEKTVDGSGLDENDGHSATTEHMWLSASPDADPWIQYEFDTIYKLNRMLIWNSNQAAESAVGWGLKDVQIETSLDGETWTVVEGITQLTRAPGTPGAGPTDDIDLGGIPAQYVRISITNNWGGILSQYSLSEVRFYYIPVQAREPQPASGTSGALPNVVLSWRAGREAGSHDVYVDTDVNAVLDGAAPANTVTENSFDLASLNLPIGETYYWKVNEVNDAEDPSVWEGPVWNFNIPDPLVVDDFESYSTDDIAIRPYVTWRDGLPYSNPAPGDEGNGTGAIVGHDIFSPGSPFFNGDLMETSLIHGGTQSLPLYYDNSGNGGNEPYSEMTRTFASPQDWSGNAIATLTLYFRGVEGNTGQLYVKINNTKIVFTDDPGAISRPMWQQWNIDLASSGANLSSVSSLTVGIENAGSGLVYVDDIVLYRNAPAAVQGTDPGNAGLVASYSMENNVNDDTGNYNGTTTGDPAYEAGISGMALTLDGGDDFVDLPIGSVISSQSDMTVTSWVKFANNGGAWQRIFDFGTGTANYMFLTPSENISGPVRFAIINPDVEGESAVDGLVAIPAEDWHHVAVSIDSSTMTITLYVDGSVVGSGPTELLPQDLGQTTQNWLGRSQWAADAFFAGALDEFLIYDRALSEAEIRYLAGEQ